MEQILDTKYKVEQELDIYLTDLIDVPLLQKLQDGFADFTGMAALTTDIDGVPVTEGTNFSDFCMNGIRSTEAGRNLCSMCDKYGAAKTLKEKKNSTYYCHAGLVEFAAPIILNGKMIGSFIGGQVLDHPVDEARVRAIASELEIDGDKLFEYAKRVSVCDRADIDKAASFLEEVAATVSEMAYAKFLEAKANADIEHAASMKTDFLANMSHEIRTPMNAVIGMAEMALREDLGDDAREYIDQIKKSGKTLLSIINDILDYSKIESGKMDIVPVEYEIMSVINDVAGYVTNNYIQGDVDLVLNINPGIPHLLLGDNIRVKQVLSNIASNAGKFTAKGEVRIDVDYDEIDDDNIFLHFKISDTGIGIKEEDMPNLFESFQQVDSKRNREKEGTGLGLAISRRLVALMGGELTVSSEYGKGTEFCFSIAQKVIDRAPSIAVLNPQEIVAYCYFSNPYLARQFENDGKLLKVKQEILIDEYDIFNLAQKENVYLFIDERLITARIKTFISENTSVTVVVIKDKIVGGGLKLPNVINIKRPNYVMTEAMIYNHDYNAFREENIDDEFDFFAPKARILIVDDNAVNLAVAEGLMRPANMIIDTAMSGAEAIKKLANTERYDIVFMDHMMPIMDGIETTRAIREKYPELKDMPIIALTANAVEGAKEMFIECGMDDFLAKPIDVKYLIQKLRQYLPNEKIMKSIVSTTGTDSN